MKVLVVFLSSVIWNVVIPKKDSKTQTIKIEYVIVASKAYVDDLHIQLQQEMAEIPDSKIRVRNHKICVHIYIHQNQIISKENQMSL